MTSITLHFTWCTWRHNTAVPGDFSDVDCVLGVSGVTLFAAQLYAFFLTSCIINFKVGKILTSNFQLHHHIFRLFYALLSCEKKQILLKSTLRTIFSLSSRYSASSNTPVVKCRMSKYNKIKTKQKINCVFAQFSNWFFFGGCWIAT